MDDSDAARDGWRLVQLAQLARDAQRLARGVREALEGFDPDELHADGTATLEPARLDGVLNDVCALRDVAEHAGMIGGDFTPHGRLIQAPTDAIDEVAAEALSEGSGDIAVIQLAARMLDRKRGFPALARGIETDPIGHVGQWGDTSIRNLLACFRDVGAGDIERVSGAAGVSSLAVWSSLDSGALARVASALRDASGT